MKKPLKTFVTIATALTLVLGNVVAVSAAPYYDLGTGKVYTAETLKPGNPEREELKDLDPEKVGVAIGEKVYSLKNLENKLVEVFAEGGIEEVQNFFTNPENLEEFEAELPGEKELKVVEVSAIDKTIELNVAVFEAEEDAKANVEIFKLNKDGEKTTPSTLKLTNLEIKEDKVVVDASNVTLGDADYAIVVKIGDVEKEVVETIEFDAVEKLVANINKATAAQLATLLNNEDYFTGFDIAKVDAYYTAKEAAKPLGTVADVQELVIDAVAANAEFDAFVEEIKETKGVFAKYTLLKATFEYVDDANMNEYMDDAGPIFTDNDGNLEIVPGLTSFEAIQDEIDQINLDAVVNNDGVTIDDDGKPSELNAYKSALEALKLVNEDTEDTNGSQTKEEIIQAIDTKLGEIADAREAADAEIVKARAALAAYETAFGDGFADETVYKNVVESIEALEAEDLSKNGLATTTLSTRVAALEAATKAITIVSVAEEALVAFEAAFAGADDLSALDADSDVSSADAGVDKYLDVMKELYKIDDVSGKFETDADGNFVVDDSLDVDDLSDAIDELDAETAEWVTYNAVIAAKTATEMRGLLFEFTSDYIDLTSAQKLEFAERFIEVIADADDTDKEDYADIEALLAQAVTDYTGLITNVNAETSISGMIADLEAIEDAGFVEGFKALGAQAQSDIAEAVLGGAPYATIADIVAAMGL